LERKKGMKEGRKEGGKGKVAEMEKKGRKERRKKERSEVNKTDIDEVKKNFNVALLGWRYSLVAEYLPSVLGSIPSTEKK
jgi:hypothetical protein